jgi:hypothetical protein
MQQYHDKCLLVMELWLKNRELIWKTSGRTNPENSGEALANFLPKPEEGTPYFLFILMD